MTPDLHRLPVGVREDGELWTLPILGSHCYIAGATGSGKGSVIWSMVSGPIHDGTAQVWAIDPKGGMETRSRPRSLCTIRLNEQR